MERRPQEDEQVRRPVAPRQKCYSLIREYTLSQRKHPNPRSIVLFKSSFEPSPCRDFHDRAKTPYPHRERSQTEAPSQHCSRAARENAASGKTPRDFGLKTSIRFRNILTLRRSDSGFTGSEVDSYSVGIPKVSIRPSMYSIIRYAALGANCTLIRDESSKVGMDFAHLRHHVAAHIQFHPR